MLSGSEDRGGLARAIRFKESALAGGLPISIMQDQTREPILSNSQDAPGVDPGVDPGANPGAGQPQRTCLYAWHQARGARLVPFAGFSLPLHYGGGLVAEHHKTRQEASLFDVSHMGQLTLSGPGVAGALEQLVPLDLHELPVGHMRYAVLPNAAGGVLDDLLVSRLASDRFGLVVNASRQKTDEAWLRAHVPPAISIEASGEALLALQGPCAAAVLGTLMAGVEKLAFMRFGCFTYHGRSVRVARSGYTGEDGFEVALPPELAPVLADALVSDPRVGPAGLGARDSLRLEAGLCLYGQELTETLSPVAAGLAWTIGKRRRQEGGFLGSNRILEELQTGPAAWRVGIILDGRAPVRAGAILTDTTGTSIGVVSSGGFSPSLEKPIAMGYVRGYVQALPGRPASPPVSGEVRLMRRQASLIGQFVSLPFLKPRFYRGNSS